MPIVIWIMMISGVSGVTDSEIARAIKELGAPQFETREKAAEFLWAAGNQAVGALKQATENTDPEVAMRARRIIDNLRYGIRPDTPPEIRELLQRYAESALPAKQGIVGKLFALGEKARPYLVALAQNEPDFGTRVAIFQPLLQSETGFEEMNLENPMTDEQLALVLKQMKFFVDIFPEDITIPLTVIPRLEALDKKSAATQLFEESLAAQRRLCEDKPKDPERHNNFAWLCAVTHRNLAEAAEHAGKAVELAPEQAAYLDTLAEVHFQRGDQKKAIALLKKCVELDPATPYFQQQLERIQAGDPAVPPPVAR